LPLNKLFSKKTVYFTPQAANGDIHDVRFAGKQEPGQNFTVTARQKPPQQKLFALAPRVCRRGMEPK
jgi:hypothetical protein